jgi:glucose/arabinose dehydrogenase
MNPTPFVLAAVLAAAVAGCGETARLPHEAGIGPRPELPAPAKTLLPTVNIAPAQGWPADVLPQAAAGLQVRPFARALDHPRWLLVLPNGDVLVAEANKPQAQGSAGGGIANWIKGKVSGWVMARAGAGVPSADRITLLRDADGDGVAETRSTLLDRSAGLSSPFGMALVGDLLYVANADAVLRYPYKPGDTTITAAPTRLTDLPAGINHHWTKSLLASADGRKLYVGVGSNSNVGENGLDQEEGRAAVWEIDIASGARRLFATGLRNPVGLGWEPQTGALWAVVNERDELGSDLVPDYLTSVKDGAFYGWPWSYFGSHVDTRVTPPRPDMVAKAISPDYALGAHVAPLGMAFSNDRMAAPYSSGAFIGQHGSWNRKPRSGYNVVFVPFAGGKPNGKPVEVLTGFVSPEGKAWGRPVGVALDAKGALLVADDVGNVVWRVGR